jgi:hypothetical protein
VISEVRHQEKCVRNDTFSDWNEGEDYGGLGGFGCRVKLADAADDSADSGCAVVDIGDKAFNIMGVWGLAHGAGAWASRTSTGASLADSRLVPGKNR